MSDPNDFSAFLEQRRQVAQAYVNGDAGPLGEIATQANPATVTGPIKVPICIAGALICIALLFAELRNQYGPRAKFTGTDPESP